MMGVLSRQARILAVHPGAELYGSDRMFLESVRGFTAAGHEVRVVVPHAGPLVLGLQEAGADVAILETPVLRKSALSVPGLVDLLHEARRMVPRTARLMRGYRPDVVYVSTMTLPMWLLLGRRSRARVVCHVHEAERDVHRVIRGGMALPLGLADVVIANSHFAASVLRTSLPPLARRTIVVPNGVAGPPDGHLPPRARLDGEVALLYAGRLSPRKGPDIAMAATRALLSTGVPVTLDVLGSVFPGYEWFEERLRDQASDLIAADVVRLHGFADAPWGALARSDIALVPSVLPEPFGNAAVEAILAQRPLVVSQTGGLPEAVAGAGSAKLVAPGEPLAVADGVRRIVERWSEMPGLSAKARAVAERRFAPEAYRRRVSELAVGPRRPGLAAAAPLGYL